MARTTSAARAAAQSPKPAPRELSKWQRAREIALLDAGLTKSDVLRELHRRGIMVARSTVGKVIEGVFRNVDVIAMFCVLTKTERRTMFPDAEVSAREKEWRETRGTKRPGVPALRVR